MFYCLIFAIGCVLSIKYFYEKITNECPLLFADENEEEEKLKTDSTIEAPKESVSCLRFFSKSK